MPAHKEGERRKEGRLLKGVGQPRTRRRKVMRAGRRKKRHLGESEQKTRAGDTEQDHARKCPWELWRAVATLELCRWGAAWWRQSKNQSDPPCCFQSGMAAPACSDRCSCISQGPLHQRKAGVSALKATSMHETKQEVLS